MASTGFNKLDDIFRQKGSTRLLPYGGVLSGVDIGAVTAAAGVVTIPVTAGKILLDVREFDITAGSVVSTALPNGLNKLEVYVRPVRKTPALTALPGTGVAGDTCFVVVDADANNQYLDKAYVYQASAWVEKDLMYEPNTDYFRNMPLSAITGGVFALSDEKAILYKPTAGGLPPEQTAMNGAPSFVRYPAGFKVATINVTLTAGAIATPATDLVIKKYKPAKIPV